MAIKKYTNGSWVSASYRKYGTETDAITTLPATIIGDGTPISSYIIKGNTEQSGTPTPENPIMPSGCGERTENIIEDYLEQAYIGIASQGVVSSYSSVDLALFPIEQGLVYTIQRYESSMELYVGFFASKPMIGSVTYDQTVHTPASLKMPTFNFVAPITGWAAVRSSRNMRPKATVCAVKGSTAPTSYIPYGYKLPLTLGGTTTNIYLGEVQSTRRIKKLVLTGAEIWLRQADSHTTCINLYTAITSAEPNSTITSNIVTYNSSAGVGNDSIVNVGRINNAGTYLLMDLDLSDFATADDWRTYLQQQYTNGTPVTVWYILAEPETAVVNEPLMKIGDYVDSVSGTNLATSGTAQELDVGTTLKPSELDLTYHGWHEHEDTKFTT